MSKHTESIGAIRAADCILRHLGITVSSDSLAAEMANIIDRETAAPELVRACQLVADPVTRDLSSTLVAVHAALKKAGIEF